MGRRSNEQICDDLRKERARLYTRRYRVKLKLENKKLKGDARKKLNEKYDQIEKRLGEIKIKLFKCGKKYASFKGQRRKLRQHQRYLLRKSKKLQDKIQAAPTKTEQKKIKRDLARTYREMRKTAETLNKVEQSMQLPIGEMKKGTIGFTAIKGGKFITDEVLWALSEMFRKWNNSGEFVVLVLDDEMIDMQDDPVLAQIKVDEAIAEAMAWQHINPSPHFFAFGDVPNGYLEIHVLNYTGRQFEKDKKRYGVE